MKARKKEESGSDVNRAEAGKSSREGLSGQKVGSEAGSMSCLQKEDVQPQWLVWGSRGPDMSGKGM